MNIKIDLEKYKYFFFDFDGVIVDSLGIKTQAFEDLFQVYGDSVVQKVREYHLENGGISRFEKFKYYYIQLLHKEITSEMLDALGKKYSLLVVEKVVKAKYITGAIEFIANLNRCGQNCFIISGTPEDEMREIVKKRNIGHFFKEIVGSPKSKKENLLFLLTKYKAKSSESLYFGDAKSDYEAAQANNLDFIGVAQDVSSELAKIDNITKIKDFCFGTA